MPDYASSLTVFGIPRRHYHCHLHNFDFSDHTYLQRAVDVFLEQEANAPHLLLTGPPVVCKTHISVGLYRTMVSRHGTGTCLWLAVPDFIYRLKARMDEPSREDPFLQVTEARDFVALDDLFGRELTPYELNNIIYPLIQIAHSNHAPLVITTNYDLEQVAEVMTPHELDRIMDSCEVITFKGESRRP